MNNIYQHFRDSEKEFIELASDWVRRVMDQYTPYLTSFLDPREQYILTTIVGQYDDVELAFDGGYEKAERKRALIFQKYYQVQPDDFEISVIEFEYATKFNSLSHGSIMGSVLGAGITRDKLGDIINADERWQCFIDNAMKVFIAIQVNKIGRVTVNIKPVALDNIIEEENKWVEDTAILSSLRLDTFLAGCLNMGRDKVKTLIESGRVKLNWAEMDKANITIEQNDIISVRGFGRIQYLKLLSRTKKDKYLIKINKLLHK